MGLPKLIDLADVLRNANQQVEELPAWKTTSRTNDAAVYKSGTPNHIMYHHTATGTGAHNPHSNCRREANSLQLAEPNEPTCNLGLCPHGVWFVIAAGPTNTNGIGIDTWHPVGDPNRVPNDSMNSYAIGIELMNNGIGEPYPVGMQDALLRGAVALHRHYRIGVYEARAHFEWAPTRKIDPAGPSRWINVEDKYQRWNMGKFRFDIQTELNKLNVPPLKPFPKGKEMLSGIFDCSYNGGSGIKFLVYTSGKKIWIADQGMWDGAKALCAINGLNQDVQTIADPGLFAAMGIVEGPSDPNTDDWGLKVR